MCCNGLLHMMWVALALELELFQACKMVDAGNGVRTDDHNFEDPNNLLELGSCIGFKDNPVDFGGALEDKKLDIFELVSLEGEILLVV